MAQEEQQVKIETGNCKVGKKRKFVSLIDWIVYIPFVALWAVILLFFDVLQRVALLCGKDWHEKSVDLLNSTLVFLLRIVNVGVRVRYEVPLKREDLPFLVVANHQSLYDIPILHAIFRGMRPKFVAKKELSKWIPSVSFNLRHGGAAIIDRDNPRQAITQLIRFAERMMKEKFTGIVFPEGTRARDGQIRDFQTNGLTTILRKVDEIQIIPVTIEGSWRLYPCRYGPIPRGILIRVTVHKPLTWKAGQDATELLREAESLIRKRLIVDRNRNSKIKEDSF